MPMNQQFTKLWPAFATLGILLALVLSVAAQQSSSLIIAGQPGSARVIQIDGKNYVEVEGLARLTNGAISFSGNQIVLNLQSATAAAPASAAPDTGFSKEFVTAGMEAMAQMREWHAALKNAIDRGYPLAEDWLAANRVQA